MSKNGLLFQILRSTLKYLMSPLAWRGLEGFGEYFCKIIGITEAYLKSNFTHCFSGGSK